MMNMTMKAKDRILSLLLVVCLALGLILPTTVTSRAELPKSDDSAIGEAYDGIDFEALTNSGFYYGAYNHAGRTNGTKTPILWRVMGEDNTSGNLTLFSEYVVENQLFQQLTSGQNNENKWETSEIRTWLNSIFLDSFNPGETNSIQNTNVTTSTYTLQGTVYVENSRQETVDKVYLPWGTYNGVNSVHEYKNKVWWNADDGSGTIPEDYVLDDNGATQKGVTSAKSSYWLRSPSSGNSTAALAVSPINDSEVIHTTVSNVTGVRPIFQLNPKSVLFLSEIGSDEENGGTRSDGNYSSTPITDKPNYKLTILSTESKLNSLSGPKGNLTGNGEELSVISGNSVTLSGSIGGTAEKLVYKIVDRTSGNIVGYGAGDGNSVTVRGIANVTEDGPLTDSGDYTLYVWAQKDNEINSHEGSKPMWFRLAVEPASSDASLLAVSGQGILAGTESGAADNPITATISLGYSVTTIADSDLLAADGATARLYDDTYIDPQSSITLADGDNDLYIKVTAQDNQTALHYHITAIRTAEPILSAFPSQLDFGDVKIDNTSVKQITVTGANLTVSIGYSISGDDVFSVNTTDDWDDYTGGKLEVTFSPDGEQDFTATLTISSHDTADRTIPLSGTGVPKGGTTDPEPDIYTVTVLNDGNGIGKASPRTAEEGQLVTLTATPNDGYRFKEWQVISGEAILSDIYGNPATFQMTGKDVTVMATFERTGGGNEGANRTSSGSRDRTGSNNLKTETKTQIPSSAFSWDGRTLIIDHDDVTALGLMKVLWDGVETTAYTVYSGSVIIQFDEAFIAAQSDGAHTVGVEFFNHIAEVTVTMGADGAAGVAVETELDSSRESDDEYPDNPRTGGYQEQPDMEYAPKNAWWLVTLTLIAMIPLYRACRENSL